MNLPLSIFTASTNPLWPAGGDLAGRAFRGHKFGLGIQIYSDQIFTKI